MPRWGAGCAFLDYDRDGHLDLFVSNFGLIQSFFRPSNVRDELQRRMWPVPHGLSFARCARGQDKQIV